VSAIAGLAKSKWARRFRYRQDFEKFPGRCFFQELENVARNWPSWALFDDDEIVDLAERSRFRQIGAANSFQTPGRCSRLSKIVAGFSNRAATGGIVTMPRMVQRVVLNWRK